MFKAMKKYRGVLSFFVAEHIYFVAYTRNDCVGQPPDPFRHVGRISDRNC